MSALQLRSEVFHPILDAVASVAAFEQFTLQVNTIFEDSPLEFDKWPLFWLYVEMRRGNIELESGRDLRARTTKNMHKDRKLRLMKQGRHAWKKDCFTRSH